MSAFGGATRIRMPSQACRAEFDPDQSRTRRKNAIIDEIRPLALIKAGPQARRNVLMVLTDGDVIRETDEELLIFDVSDDALERVASVGVGLSVVSLNFGTSIVGNCACPV
jgi:hypothetical protein